MRISSHTATDVVVVVVGAIPGATPLSASSLGRIRRRTGRPWSQLATARSQPTVCWSVRGQSFTFPFLFSLFQRYRGGGFFTLNSSSSEFPISKTQCPKRYAIRRDALLLQSVWKPLECDLFFRTSLTTTS